MDEAQIIELIRMEEPHRDLSAVRCFRRTDGTITLDVFACLWPNRIPTNAQKQEANEVKEGIVQTPEARLAIREAAAIIGKRERRSLLTGVFLQVFNLFVVPTTSPLLNLHSPATCVAFLATVQVNLLLWFCIPKVTSRFLRSLLLLLGVSVSVVGPYMGRIFSP